MGKMLQSMCAAGNVSGRSKGHGSNEETLPGDL